MIYSMDEKKRYLILVPRIILMEQFKIELIKHKPKLKKKIQTLGDNNNEYDKDKTITICVYNSVYLIEKYCDTFDKIFIDEAHHIDNPMIYDNDDVNENIIDNDLEEDNNDNEKESIIEDDSEDEIKRSSNYINIIKSLLKYKNNVYFSATIDKIDDFQYYCKDIRDMINKKYLSDYTIHIPIFSDDPTNKNICEHLIKNYRNIILYCNSQKEGKKINDMLNSIRKGSSKYIDCKTTKTKRNDIIDSYKNDKIAFLVNVRILVEGFDAPITKGVCFIHLPSSKTTIIQIIGRALRLHPLKTFANIILPFSNKDDEDSINKFLKILANNDKRIKQTFENKKDGGYIAIEKIRNDVIIDEDDSDEEEEKDIFEMRYEMIYNSMGVLQNAKEIWMKKMEWVKQYIDKYEKRPSYADKNNNIRIYATWLSRQIQLYKKNMAIMKQRDIRTIFENFLNEYKKYFMSDKDIWLIKFKQAKQYIIENIKRPNVNDNDKDTRELGLWLIRQVENYNKNIGTVSVNKNIHKIFEKFLNEYKKYFMSDKDIWLANFKQAKQYIIENNERPKSNDKNKDIKKIGKWFVCQTKKYKENIGIIVTDMEIKEIWETFINDDKYKMHFISDDDFFKYMLEIIKKYIDKYNKLPS